MKENQFNSYEAYLHCILTEKQKTKQFYFTVKSSTSTHSKRLGICLGYLKSHLQNGRLPETEDLWSVLFKACLQLKVKYSKTLPKEH